MLEKWSISWGVWFTVTTITSSGRSLPGTATSPVMKSEEMNVLITTDRWKVGRWSGLNEKSMGMSITGI